jgi:peptidoglycan/xylan/chitin deacetylase (PgdA/CDA1 family)
VSSENVVSILSYHKIGPPSAGAARTWYYVSEAEFVGHLTTLEDKGWMFISIEDFLHGLASPEALPHCAVLITFDDAYRSVHEYALPILAERSYPGVVFTPTAFVGGTSTFDRAVPEPLEPICTPEELRELDAAGISVQSHGVSHTRLSELAPDEVLGELTRSKAFLEDLTGSAVEAFAYPYGDAGEPGLVRPLLDEAGYRCAFLYGGGPFSLPGDPYRVPRVPLGSDSVLPVNPQMQ